MKYIAPLILVAVLLVVTVSYLVWPSETNKRIIKVSLAPQPVSSENAKLALDRLCDWTKWLVPLQTTALAAMALIFKDRKPNVMAQWLGFL